MTPLWWSKADDDPGRGGDAVASGFKEPEGHGSEEPQGHDSTEPQGHDSTEPQGHEAEDPAMSPVFAVSCFEVKPRCFLICQTELMLGGVSHTCCLRRSPEAVVSVPEEVQDKTEEQEDKFGGKFFKAQGSKALFGTILVFIIPEGPVVAWETHHKRHEPRDQEEDHWFPGEPQEEPIQELAHQVWVQGRD